MRKKKLSSKRPDILLSGRIANTIFLAPQLSTDSQIYQDEEMVEDNCTVWIDLHVYLVFVQVHVHRYTFTNFLDILPIM